MLFHITHVHTEATCPYHKPEVVSETFGKVLPAFEEAGATVLGAYTDAPAHAMYLIVEASTADQVRLGLAPIIDQGTAEVRPVSELGKVAAELSRR